MAGTRGRPTASPSVGEPSASIRRRVNAAGEGLLEQPMQRFGLNSRAHDRIGKVARAIADLAGAAEIGVEHLSEVIQYRVLDRQMGCRASASVRGLACLRFSLPRYARAASGNSHTD